jgi:hypothetical protein
MVVFPAPHRVLVVGDSVAYTMRRAFRHQRPSGMSVTDDGVVGCSPGGPDHPRMRFYTGQELDDPCSDSVTRWPARVASGRFDGVLMIFGASGLDREFDGEWRHPCDPVYDSWFQSSVENHMRALQFSGARVWITLAPYNRHASVASPDAQAQADRQTDCLNRAYQSAAAAVGGVAVVDLHGLICPPGQACTTSIDGIELRPDGLHFDGAGADVIARWLLLQLGPPPDG